MRKDRVKQRTQKYVEIITLFITKIITVIPWIGFILLSILLIINDFKNIKFANTLIIPMITEMFEIIKELSVDSMLTLAIGMSGFSITAMSIFGIGSSGATIKINDEGFTDDFIFYALQSIVSSIALLLFSFGINKYSSKYIKLLYLTILLYSVFNILRFGIVTIAMYSYNLKNINEELEEDKKEKLQLNGMLNSILDTLNSLNMNIKNNKKEDNNEGSGSREKRKEVLAKKAERYNKRD